MKKDKFDLFKSFSHFHEDNPGVFNLFKKFTFQIIARGHKHFSADAIVHRIRWESSIETTDKDFKISNNHVMFYGRLFMSMYPEHKELFRTHDVDERVRFWVLTLIKNNAYQFEENGQGKLL